MKRSFKAEIITFAVALFILAALNVAFWKRLYGAVDPSDFFEWCFLVSVFLAAAAALNLALILISSQRVFKLIVIPLLILSAAASYYMAEYGVLIDRNMVRNILETNSAEAADLITGKFVLTIVMLGLLPAWLIWRTPVSPRSAKEDLWARAKVAAASVAVFASVTAPFYMDYTSVFREHEELKHTFVPLNFLSATAKYAAKNPHAKAVAAAPVGIDAHQISRIHKSGSKLRTVSVLVIGETARGANFSLSGYERPTNPELSKINELLYFNHVTSCGTDTAQSVPCMFSGAGRKGFEHGSELEKEGLLDILKHAGIKVLWRENQSGCKGVCKRVPTEVLTDRKESPYFENGESHDEILVDGLEQKISALTGDGVVVLHMMGSHGPAYYKRYPKSFEIFTPACHESQFSKCTTKEIVNAYDNTIRYTDHVLAQIIGILGKLDAQGFAASMMYLSDHGESLGENNLYLHGMPFALAPDQQIHVPMALWISPKARDNLELDTACMRALTSSPLSHDNFFHTVLGLLDIETSLYHRELDVIASCRQTQSTGAVHQMIPKL